MKVIVEIGKTPSYPADLRRHLHDIELAALRVRKRDGNVWTVRNPTEAEGTPEVYWGVDEPVRLGREWQYFIVAINPGMPLQKIAALFGTRRAFCNRKGFPGRANYILEEDLGQDDPQYSKVYMCGGNVMSVIESGGTAQIVMMDGRQPPPLKPGKTHPQTVEEARGAWERYLYNPRDQFWMFITAVNVSDKGTPDPFPNGGIYDWTPDASRMFSFLPLVSISPVIYFADHLQPVKEWVSPYQVFLP